jgi:N-acetylmuramoyl-L-alanine amidase
MNGGLLYFLVLVLGIGIGLWLLRQPAVWTSIPLASLVSGRKVVIDAGHGGGDPGAKSRSGLVEKQLNLEIALRLKKHLSRVGVYCVMIREQDIDYFGAAGGYGTKKRRDLNHRVHIVNQSKADIFLSIHANSFPQIVYHGAQTFYNQENPESKRLAEAIQGQLVNRLGPNHRKAKGGDFRVLNSIKIPGVIIETGFLSNHEEARLLATEQYREKLSYAIYQGVIAYFSKAP